MDENAICDELIELHRERERMLKAETATTLQIKASCRKLCDGDKADAGKLYDALQGNGAVHPLMGEALTANADLLQARAILHKLRLKPEGKMRKRARQLAVWPWVDTIAAWGDLGLAMIVGEAGNLSRFPTCAKLWKWMCLAVMPDGKRQRAIRGPDGIGQSYNPARRAVMYRIANPMVMNGDPEQPYRAAYDTYKAHQVGLHPELSVKHRNFRAHRYLIKCMLRGLWREWRRANRALSERIADSLPATASTSEQPTLEA